MNLHEHWALVRGDLARARDTLPQDAGEHDAILRYNEFLDNNELELACEMLELFAETHLVGIDFWFALHDAATRMQLPEMAARFQRRAESS